MKVVVVESPAKAKTINKYLGNDYKVVASYGHVRDLPAKDGSVLPDSDFAMSWEVDGHTHITDDARQPGNQPGRRDLGIGVPRASGSAASRRAGCYPCERRQVAGATPTAFSLPPTPTGRERRSPGT